MSLTTHRLLIAPSGGSAASEREEDDVCLYYPPPHREVDHIIVGPTRFYGGGTSYNIVPTVVGKVAHSLIPALSGYWRMSLTRSGRRHWIETSLAEVSRLSQGSNRTYAELALRSAAEITDTPPSISRAPEGGILLEHRYDDRFVTLIIEDKIGVLVSSSKDMQTSATFDINMTSINELIRRYEFELKQCQLG